MQSWKQCLLPVITIMALWQLMYHVATVHHVPKCMSYHKVIVVITRPIIYKVFENYSLLCLLILNVVSICSSKTKLTTKKFTMNLKQWWNKIFEFKDILILTTSFYLEEIEKQTFDKINNKIAMFLIVINEERRVLTNEVCAVYISHLEDSLPRYSGNEYF